MLQAAAPFVHMLHVPTTRLPTADSSSLAPQQQQQGEVYSRQRQVLLVLSSAALQLLQPGELQAAMAGALTPALLARVGEQFRLKDMQHVDRDEWRAHPAGAKASLCASQSEESNK